MTGADPGVLAMTEPETATRPARRGPPGRGLDARRAIWIGLALAFSFAAQYLFTGELLGRSRDTQTWDWPPRYTAATLLLLAGAAAAATGLRGGGPRVLPATPATALGGRGPMPSPPRGSPRSRATPAPSCCSSARAKRPG